MSKWNFYLLLPMLAVLAFGSVSFAQEFDKEALKAELRAELKAELKRELLSEIKEEMKAEIQSETKAEVQQATFGLRNVMNPDFKAELRAEIMEETRGDISSEIEKALGDTPILGGMFKGLTVGGFVDTMFSYNLRQHGEDVGENTGDIGGWNFIGENDDNTFTLESFAMFFDKEATDDHPIGWQAHLYFGEKAKRITFLGNRAGVFDDAAAASGTDDTARNDIVTIAVGNLTWNAPVAGKSVPITMGKMYTWIGYELVENIGNPNYSHGVVYNNAIPFTHMGISFDVSEFLPSDKWGLQLKYVNGWDSFIDNNESKSYGFYLTYQPNDDFFISLATIYGNEGWNVRENGAVAQSMTANNNGDATMMYDIVATYSLPQVDKLSLGFNWDHGYIEDFIGHSDGSRGAGIFTSTTGAHWWAAVGYLMYDWTDNQQGALRYEYMDDADGARAFGYSINTLTYTHNVTVAENLMLRPEIRWNKHNTGDGREPAVGDKATHTADSEVILTFGAEYVF